MKQKLIKLLEFDLLNKDIERQTGFYERNGFVHVYIKTNESTLNVKFTPKEFGIIRDILEI